MEAYRKYFDPQTLASIQGLELRARHIVEGYVSGLHASPYHGFSIEFAEHREYAPGDDLRYLDWKVFGKTDKFYLKQFEAETNLVSYLLLDTSESMAYQSASAPWSKLEYGKTAAAALAYLVLQQQDSIGLMTFDDRLRSSVRPSSNPSHLKQVLHALEDAPARRKTSVGPLLHDLAERLKRRGVVVIISDMFDDVRSVLAGLKHFRHRRHEVIVLHVLDPAEIEFPFDRPTLFKGLEGLPDVLTDPVSLRRAYLQEFGQFTKALEAGCRDQHFDYLRLRTDEPLDRVLSGYLAARQARIK